MDGCVASTDRGAFDPMRSEAGSIPALRRAPDLMLANPLSCHPG